MFRISFGLFSIFWCDHSQKCPVILIECVFFLNIIENKSKQLLFHTEFINNTPQYLWNWIKLRSLRSQHERNMNRKQETNRRQKWNWTYHSILCVCMCSFWVTPIAHKKLKKYVYFPLQADSLFVFHFNRFWNLDFWFWFWSIRWQLTYSYIIATLMCTMHTL